MNAYEVIYRLKYEKDKLASSIIEAPTPLRAWELYLQDFMIDPACDKTVVGIIDDKGINRIHDAISASNRRDYADKVRDSINQKRLKKLVGESSDEEE